VYAILLGTPVDPLVCAKDTGNLLVFAQASTPS
jgi:hypothetical protein